MSEEKVVCRQCGDEFITMRLSRRGAPRKYCDDCIRKKDAARHKAYIEKMKGAKNVL